MRQELIIVTPDGRQKRVPLVGDRYTIGRSNENDFCCVDDQSLSRFHCRLFRRGEQWSIEDLRSKNGTLLNGQPVDVPQVLHPRDRISAGQLSLTLVSAGSDPSDDRVIFVPQVGPDLPGSVTMMTSLDGLLSSDPTGKQAAASATEALRPFESPVVQALIRAGRELAHHQPLAELFPVILDLSIRAVTAERGVLMTLVGDELMPRAVHGQGFRISATVRDRVVKEKASLLVRDVQSEDSLRAKVSLVQTNVQSLMAVPLQTENRVIGLIYVDSSMFGRRFTADDLNLLTVLANVAAIRIEHEGFIDLRRQDAIRTRELEQAAEIQQGILPQRAPSLPGVELAGYNRSCRTVGGDYYDFIVRSDGRVLVLVGDVAGKGMAAAMLMSALQARVQMLAEDVSDPAKILHRLNRSLSRNCPANRFITMFVAMVDPESGEVVYANAGHNPPLLVRAQGPTEELTAPGPVLGVLPDADYGERRTRMGPGDLLAVYSDGVTEAMDPDEQEFGIERFRDLLESCRFHTAEEVVERVTDGLRQHVAEAAAADDVTLVVVRRIAEGREQD